MFRVFQQAVSSLTIVGYFLAVTWGPAWHDHHHGHCHHAHTEVQGQPPACETPHVHACCGHHHHDCGAQSRDRAESNTGPSPCPAPLHDDDCVVCQLFAHPPLAAPEIKIIDAAQPLVERAVVLCPPPACSLPAAYDSRGPPLV